MTKRLYYHDATARSFRARVLELDDEGVRVRLDRTAFYPTSGGQPHDRGVLGGVAVVDVVDERDQVIHVLSERAAFAAGDEVEGTIDWPRRLDHMQQHTGQHLLSAVCDEMIAARTVSVHFGAESSTVDVEPTGTAGLLPDDALEAIERRANEIVMEARPVSTSFEDAAVASGLRKASDRDGTLRIISIDGLDRSACGGTHVASTSEIGPILIRRQERVRSTIRLEFVCGYRALARVRRDLSQLTAIARQYSASIDDVAGLVETNVAAARELEASHRRLQEHLATAQADALYHAARPDAEGMRTVLDRRASGSADGSRAVALAAIRHPRAVFVAASDAPPTILLATSADSGVDAAATLRPLLQAAGGRGGGSSRLAQGTVPDVAAVRRVLQQLLPEGQPAGATTESTDG